MTDDILTNICAPFLVQTPERTVLILFPVGPKGDAGPEIPELIAKNLLANRARPEWVAVAPISVGDFVVADHTIVVKNTKPDLARDFPSTPSVASAWEVSIPATATVPAGRRVTFWHPGATIEDVHNFMQMHGESHEQISTLRPVALRIGKDLGSCYVRAEMEYASPAAPFVRSQDDLSAARAD